MSISSSSIAVGWGGHAWCSIVVRPVTRLCYFGFPGERGGATTVSGRPAALSNRPGAARGPRIFLRAGQLG